MTPRRPASATTAHPSAALGAALTLMMMEQGEVCPTANCEQPADGLPFDPVPGTRTRPLDFDYALELQLPDRRREARHAAGRPGRHVKR